MGSTSYNGSPGGVCDFLTGLQGCASYTVVSVPLVTDALPADVQQRCPFVTTISVFSTGSA